MVSTQIRLYPSSSQHSLLSSRFHWGNFLCIQAKILARLIAPFLLNFVLRPNFKKIKGKDRGWTEESSNSLYKSQNYPSRPFEVHSTVFKLIKGLQQRSFFFFNWFNWGQACVFSHACLEKNNCLLTIGKKISDKNITLLHLPRTCCLSHYTRRS